MIIISLNRFPAVFFSIQQTLKYDIPRSDDSKRCGVYLCSLAWSVRRATQHFLNTVVDIEERLLTNPSLPLTVALASLKPLAPTLAMLATMVQEVGV